MNHKERKRKKKMREERKNDKKERQIISYSMFRIFVYIYHGTYQRGMYQLVYIMLRMMYTW